MNFETHLLGKSGLWRRLIKGDSLRPTFHPADVHTALLLVPELFWAHAPASSNAATGGITRHAAPN